MQKKNLWKMNNKVPRTTQLTNVIISIKTYLNNCTSRARPRYFIDMLPNNTFEGNTKK